MTFDYAEFRKIALQIAIKAGGEKTVEVIKNPRNGFGEILAAAEKELGKEVLIKHILEGPPLWSHMALIHLSDLGNDEKLLLNRADELPAEMKLPEKDTVNALDATSETLLAPIGGSAQPLSQMYLWNAMAATVQWTVNWTDGGVEQPKSSYPNWGDWWWSGNITAGCGSGPVSLATIAQKVPNATLKDGDTVWIYVWVAGGSDLNGKTSPFQFTYSSGSTMCAYWNANGTTTINHLSLTDYKTPS